MRFDDALTKDRVRRLPLTEQLAHAQDPAYWASLAAAEDPFLVDEEGIFENRERAFAGGLGWALERAPATLLAPARAGIARVELAGWPAVFALLLDETWDLLRSAPVVTAVEEALGPGAVQLPGAYVHRVERAPGARGWEPHVDVSGAEESEEAGRMTAWLALTDAPLDGGCVYATDRAATGALGEGWESRRTVEMPELLRAMHGARAVPVRAGSLVMWRRDALHWGAAVERAHGCPRLAISLEYARAALPEEQAFEPRRTLGFEERLFVLGRALCAYGDPAREPAAAPFVPLGERLLKG